MRRHRLARGALALSMLGSVLVVTRVLPTAHAAGSSIVNTVFDAPDPSPGDGICTSTLPGGECTLRAAIQTANASLGFDSITFDPALTMTGPVGDPCVGGAFIELTVGGRDEDAAATGDLDITGPLNISDNCGVTVGGNGIDRVWDMFADTTFYQIASMDGDVNPGADLRGSGILVHSPAVVNLQRSNIGDNAGGFVNPASEGGGLYAEAGTSVTIQNAIVANSHAGSGGGVWTAGHLLMSGFVGIVEGNAALVDGGGIYLAPGATAEIGGVTQSGNNHSDGNGGFLYASTGSSATLYSNQVFTSSAEGNGGHAYIEPGATVGIVDTSFRDGIADEGGGIWNDGELTVMASGFVDSSAINGDGGAIHNTATGRVEIQRSFGSTNNANQTLGDGGFLYNEGTAVVANTSIFSSSVENEGAGIWTSGPLDLRFSAMTNAIANTGPGGGLFVEPGTADVRVSNSVMVDNFVSAGNDDCSGEVTLVGVLVTQSGPCTDSATAPGLGTPVTASMSFTLTPAANTFVGGGTQVPQLVAAETTLVNAAAAVECTAVAVDGYGNARPSTTCDAGPVEGGASPAELAVAVRSDEVGIAPAFQSLPLEDLPPAAITGGLAVAGGGTTESSPLARIDFGAELSGTEDVETTPLARIPLARIPLARIPLARIPLARIGLAQIPLARIPLARIDGNPGAFDTWDEMVAGSLLVDRPLSSTTLADVLDPANWPTGGLDAFIERFEALTLEQIDLSATAIGRMPADALSVADIPLADLSIDSASPVSPDPQQRRIDNLEDWCDYFATQGYSCANTFAINPNQPASSDDVNLTVVAMVGVPLARIPLARIPLARIPLARIALLDTPLARIDYRNTPLARIPLARIQLNMAPLARISLGWMDNAERVAFAATPLGRVPLVDQFNLLPPGQLPSSLQNHRLVDAVQGARLNAVVDCAVVNCTAPASTLLTAFASRNADNRPDGVRPSATVGDLLFAFPNLTLGDIAPWAASEPTTVLDAVADVGFDGLTVNELFAAVLPPERDEITLGAVLNGFVAREDVAWDGLNLDAPELAGIDPAGGVVTYSVVVSSQHGFASPDVLTIDLPDGWRLAPGGVVDDGTVVEDSLLSTSGQTTEIEVGGNGYGSILRVTVFAGLDIGLKTATFTLRSTVEPIPPPTTTTASNGIDRSFEPNDTPAQAEIAVGGTAINPDTLYVSTIDSPGDVDLWPIIVPRGYELSVALSSMTSDYDVVVYSPPGSTEDPLIGLEGGLRQAPDRSLPFLPDFGLGLGRDDTRVQPERLQDIPLQTDRRVYAASLDRGATPERVDTPALGGGIYLIQVTGFNGVNSTDPYGLRASVRPSLASTSCTTTRPPLLNQPLPSFPAASTDSTTLFVVNSERSIDTWTPTDIGGASAVFGELTATVAAINANPGAYGGGTATILDLATIGAVNDAYVQWDAGRCEPARANGVVKAIGVAIDAAVAANTQPFDNVVLIGADDIIPMARVVDGTTLGNEREYARLFATNNELSSALSFGIVLTDDPYGDARPVQIAGRELYVPELAVGRLVEQPQQIAQALTMYRDSFGILDANTAAVTGYEFLSDGANAVLETLDQSTGGATTSLISDDWTKADLNALLGTSTKLLSINAHFDHNRALPADQSVSGIQSDPVQATDLTNEGGRRLLFSMGCHAGLSVSDVSVGVAPSDAGMLPDWAQELATHGDLLVGNTGYGYGDTDVVAASEKLMTYFAQRLDGSVSIGDAMQLAKQRYSSDLPVITPYDEKVLQQVVMYGLPMYRVRSTPGPLPDRPDGVTPGGVPGGLQTTSFGVELGVESDADPNTPDLEPRIIDRGTYWAVEEDPANLLENNERLLTAQYRPIQPQYAIEVTDTTPTPAEARGALITSLQSTDINNVNPANFRPTIDLAANEPEPVVDDAAFPDRIQGLTSFSDAAGGRQQLILSVGQFLQNPAATNGSGTQRLFTDIGGTVYYVPATNTDRTQPTIQRTDAISSIGAQAQFEVEVVDDDALLRVVVLSTDVEDPGVWQTTELTLGAGGIWRGTAAVPSTGTSAQYFVQAVDVNGNVAVSSNKAVYYLASPVDDTAPTVTATATPAALFANQDVTVTITASDGDDGSGIASLSYVRNGVPTTVINTTGAEPFATSFVVSATGTTDISYSTVDNRDNLSETGTISVAIDRQPAVISTSISPPPAGGWVAGSTAAVEATVVETGIAPGGALTYGSTGQLVVPAGTPYTGPVLVTAAGTSTLTFTTVDAAGNTATASATVSLDPVAPTATVTTPAAAATYSIGQVVNAAYSCADPAPGSGISSCTGTVANGAAIDTATAGAKTFTVTATDVAGNTFQRVVNYTVAAAPSNVAPVVRADWGVGARNVGFFNDVATVQGSFTDAAGGPWRVTVTWGNGRTATSTRTTTGAFTLTSPAYGRSGAFTVVVRVCDSANLCHSDTVTVRLRVATSSLRATVVCVTDGGPGIPPSVGRFTARFNWTNTQAFWIYAPIGTTNRFLINPANRGQPTLFSPGASTTPVTARFAILGTGWQLGNTIALATLFTRRC